MESLPDYAKIRELRKKLNISQKELGQKLGIQQSTISRIENGTMDPPYSKFKAIYDYLENESIKRSQALITANDIMTRKIYHLTSESTVKDAIELMNKYKISQVPIMDQNGLNIGSITSKKIQKFIIDNPDILYMNVFDIKELPFPEVEKNWNVREISNLLINYPAVLVKDLGKYVGIITDSNFLKLTNQ
ncbi:MAG: CBS domain-containing protein [Candidatus Lokiarchaeota archaeon]|nr:CBS domain-containing protein [Candidatus Lokiarchaeota archaeon]